MAEHVQLTKEEKEIDNKLWQSMQAGSYPQPAAGPWLPMSEAPRNETRVLLCLGDGFFVVGFWDKVYYKEVFDEQILDGLYKPVAFARIIPPGPEVK